MKLAHIPGEVFAEEWRTRPFEPWGKTLLEDFDYVFSRFESHIEGFSLDHNYLFAPLRARYFDFTTEEQHRIGQKIIESAPHIGEYRWPEFEEWYADLLTRSRLRKPKAWHLAGELWTAFERLGSWEYRVRDAIEYARTGFRCTNFIRFEHGQNEKTDRFIKENGLDGAIKYDDERLMVRHPIDPQVFLFIQPILLDMIPGARKIGFQELGDGSNEYLSILSNSN